MAEVRVSFGGERREAECSEQTEATGGHQEGLPEEAALEMRRLMWLTCGSSRKRQRTGGGRRRAGPVGPCEQGRWAPSEGL